MKQTNKLLLLMLFLGFSGLSAQDTSSTLVAPSLGATAATFDAKWEITSNVTLALSRISGNATRNLNDDPYLLMVRKLSADGGAAWRFGVNGFRRKAEDVQGGFNGPITRSSDENSASLVIGREWRRELGLGFYTYWGADVRGLWRQNKSTSVQFDGFSGRTEIITDAKEYGGSVGGIGGIGWKFHDRMMLYTESVVYGQLLRTERQFSVNGEASTLERKNTYSVLPLVPVALFLTIQF